MMKSRRAAWSTFSFYFFCGTSRSVVLVNSEGLGESGVEVEDSSLVDHVLYQGQHLQPCFNTLIESEAGEEAKQGVIIIVVESISPGQEYHLWRH